MNRLTQLLFILRASTNSLGDFMTMPSTQPGHDVGDRNGKKTSVFKSVCALPLHTSCSYPEAAERKMLKCW